MSEFRLASSSLLLVGGLVAVLCAVPSQAAPLPPPYDQLVQVRSRQLGAVYLLPGADFRPYTKVMIDPVQVSFRKDWLKNTNGSRGLAAGKISQDDAQQIAQAARSGFEQIFADAFKKKGYDVVTSPGPDVLRLTPAVVNLYVNAPDPQGAAGVRSYTVEAGEATLTLEAKDSLTGAVLGVAIDRSSTQSFGGMATSVSNRFDFGNLFRHWANTCVKGLDTLKTTAPVPVRTGKKQ